MGLMPGGKAYGTENGCFAKTFGLYRVDVETQRRTPKSSARFYADVIRSGGTVLGR